MPAGDNSLIAIDLALVPPERVQERARRINQELDHFSLWYILAVSSRTM